jgi:hypothetical protein
MKKQLVYDLVWKREYYGESAIIPFKDIANQFRSDNHYIHFRRDIEDGGIEYLTVSIHVARLQTDEEHQEMLKEIAANRGTEKHERYQLYLKLKKEFKDEKLPGDPG